MSSKSWKQVSDLFNAVLQCPPGEREAFLDAACVDQPALCKEVRSLLEAHDQPGPVDAVESYLADAFKQAPSAPDMVGQRIGPYEILEHLGDGGMGVLYKARYEKLNRTVALKFLPPHLRGNAAARERFIHEAKAASALDHPNICTIYDIGQTEEGQYFIAMAYYAGQTLKAKINQGPMPLEAVLDLGLQTTRGLARAHQQGIVHRDVKPANLMVAAPATEGGRPLVKILDFGIAKMVDVTLTQPGVQMGTIAYMSPEQARGGPVDHRTDLWALGVVLYEMLTGERPFKGEYEQAVLYSILNVAPEPVRKLRPEVPESLAAIIEKTLRKDPEKRYGSAREMGADLERVVLEKDRPQPVTPSDRHSKHTSSSAHLPEGERRLATIMAATLNGYIELVEQLPPRVVESLNQRFKDATTEIVERHGGIVNTFNNEDVVALFGVADTHEDDPVRAVRAALDLHDWVRALSDEIIPQGGQPLRLQTGMDTRLVVARRLDAPEGPYRIVGRALQVATQLAFQAEVDAVLVSPSTRRLIAPFFEMEAEQAIRVKGRKEPMQPYRVTGETGLHSRLEAAQQSGLTDYAGRDRELGTLQACLDRALAGDGQFVTVVGEAGGGKSRLLYEFNHRLDQDAVHVIHGRCESHGGSTPYLPFIDVIRHRLAWEEMDSQAALEARVVSGIQAIDPELAPFIPLYLQVLSIPSEAHPVPDYLQGDDYRLAMIDALAALITLNTKTAPTVLLLEDWHWVDEASQEVLNQLAEMVSAYPLLIVVTCRPAYTQGWGNPSHHTPLSLKPLKVAASRAIITSVLGATQLPEALAEVLHERTGGNPFFLEEICTTLLEEGMLHVEDGRAVLSQTLDQLKLPGTVQAVIRTRLHRLDQHARQVLRFGAVIGRSFSRNVLQHVLPKDTALRPSLEALRTAGLIQQTRVLPDVVYQFKHALTQEVTYESLLQHQRKRLHGQVGEAIEALYGDRLEEYLTPLARHFGEAEQWPKAVHYGYEAAEKASSLSQIAEAINLFEKTRQWVLNQPEDQSRQEILSKILLSQERLYESLGFPEQQQKLLDELFSLLKSVEDSTLLMEVYTRQGELYTVLHQYDAAETALQEALTKSQAASDYVGERKALRSIGFLRWTQNRMEEAVSINKTLIMRDRHLGDMGALLVDLLNMTGLMNVLGQFDLCEAYLREVVQISNNTQSTLNQVNALYYSGELEQRRGNFDQAIKYFNQAKDLANQHHIVHSEIISLNMLGVIYLRLGNFDKSLMSFEEAIDICRKTKYATGLVRSIRGLGALLSSLERDEEALPYLQEAATLYSQLKEHKGESEIWTRIAIIYERRENHSEAQKVWTQVKTILAPFDASPVLLDALIGLTRTAQRQAMAPEVVLNYFQDALALAEIIEDPFKVGKLHNDMGIYQWKMGAYDAALGYYEKALAIFEDLKDPTHEGLIRNSIGVTLSKLGRTDDAIACLEDAIVHHRAAEQQLLEGHALAALGQIQEEQGQYEQARTCYGASLQLRWAINDRQGEGWMLLYLARVYAAEKEQDRAHQSAVQAEAIAVEIGDTELLEACQRLAKG